MNTEAFKLEAEEISARPVKNPVVAPLRERARQVIGPIVADLKGAARKQIRTALRAAWEQFSPGTIRRGTAYKIYCEEVAIALRERCRGSRSHGRPEHPLEVIPSTRPWLAEKGKLEVPATFDVDDETPAKPAREILTFPNP